MLVRWSPDQKQVATTLRDGSVVLREARSGRLLRTFPGADQVLHATFSSSGQALAVVSGKPYERAPTLRVFDVTTGTVRRQLELSALNGDPTTLGWAPRGGFTDIHVRACWRGGRGRRNQGVFHGVGR